jgi:hypothetical protein
MATTLDFNRAEAVLTGEDISEWDREAARLQRAREGFGE